MSKNDNFLTKKKKKKKRVVRIKISQENKMASRFKEIIV